MDLSHAPTETPASTQYTLARPILRRFAISDAPRPSALSRATSAAAMLGLRRPNSARYRVSRAPERGLLPPVGALWSFAGRWHCDPVSHKLAPLKRLHISSAQRKPFATLALVREPSVPVRLDTSRIVGLD